MNKTRQLLTKGGDNRTVRAAFAMALSSLIWAIFLIAMEHSFHSGPLPERVREQSLEMNIIEIPARPFTQAGTAMHSAWAAAMPSKETRIKTQRPIPAPTHRSTPALQSKPVTRAQEISQVEPTATRLPSQPALAESPSPSTDRSAASSERASTNSTTGDSPAHGISQPLPSVPDDLREHAYQTVAVARILIHVDGSVTVELTKPTQYPRLNQIVVETLRTWRFFPAMQNGHPAESEKEIRVHFDVS